MESNHASKEAALVRQCCTLIEQKLGWPSSQQWTSADFEVLQERILSETGVSLSVSTLRRLWGKVKYESAPQAATLNALARFVGYEHWRDFVASQPVEEKQKSLFPADLPLLPGEPRELARQEPSSKKRPVSLGTIWSIGLVTGLSLALLLAFSLSTKQRKEVKPAAYAFSSRVVAAGLPNSVVFTYDASAAKTDCVYIQQSWDPKRRFPVSRTGKEATSLYYYPGVFQAKLLVDNQVVKQHQLVIKTQGWLPMVSLEPIPVYFPLSEALVEGEGQLALPLERLEASNVALQPKAPDVYYWKVGDFANLSGHDFTLETELKNTYKRGSAACQRSGVSILCDSNDFYVPLSIPGCTAGLNLYFPEKRIEGEKTDLSAFGVDFTDWVKLRIVVKDKQVTIFINNRFVFRNTFTQEAGHILGLLYSFEGTGAVNYVRLFDGNGRKVYGEEF